MCDLDISEKRKPQDGKIKFKKFGPLDIELRVATIPTAGRRRRHRDADPRRRRADPARQAGLVRRATSSSCKDAVAQALRPVLRLRPDRLGQDHHAALGAGLPQHARHQDLDRGRPGRNHAEGPAPGADEPEGGPRLRHGDEGVPARRSGHHHGRRDARQGDRRRSASRPRSPATWCSPRCTPTARRNRSSACSTWAWTRSTSPTRCSASWRSAWPSACAQVQAGVHRRRRRRSSACCDEYCARADEHRRAGRRIPKGALRSGLRGLGQGITATTRASSRSTRRWAATSAAAPATRAASACTSC